MRKITSIILTLVFVLSTLSLAAVPASAEAAVEVGKVAADYAPDAAATAVETAEQFAAMTADGNYYLAADITVSAAYTEKFTGTFDGCGKTITTSVPLFADMSGTFKNATINAAPKEDGTAGAIQGSIDIDGKGYGGSVTAFPTETVVIDNVCNNGAVNAPSTCGGIVGYAKDGSNVTITNCVNNGAITAVDGQSGGMIGYAQGTALTVKNCVNNGDIDAGASYGAGIAGRFGKDKSTVDYVCTFENCVNNGNVISGKDQVAGVVAYMVGICEITNCVNHGDLKSPKAAGGILGNSASSSKNKIAATCISDCINTGKVEGTTRVGGIAASLGQSQAPEGKKHEAKNCLNFGEIVCNCTRDKDGATVYVGGVVAYTWGGSGANGTLNCANFGKVTISCETPNAEQVKAAYVGGILGYVNASKYNFKGNVNAGEIVIVGDYRNEVVGSEDYTFGSTQLFYNKHADGAGAEYASGNKALVSEGPVYEVNGTQEAAYTTFTAEELASGSVAYAINEALGREVLFQKIGTDAIPSVTPRADGSDKLELKDGVVTNPSAVTPVDPVDPVDPAIPETGDDTALIIAVLVISVSAVFALALIPLKKFNR